MAERRKVLFLTNSEYGQANIMLAVIHELVRHGELEVHVASFHPLQLRVAQLQEQILKTGHVSPVIFHEIPGPSVIESLYVDGDVTAIMTHQPGVQGAISAYKRLPDILFPFDATQHIEGTKHCIELLQNIKPAIAVVDPLFNMGLEACCALSWKCIVLNPVLLKDIVARMQPKMARLWKYPIIIFSAKVKSIIAARKEHSLTGRLPTFEIYRESWHYLTPAVPELDYPLLVPPNVTTCGPILLPTVPISQSDPKMASWLQRQPTILISLGTIFVDSASDTREMATAISNILNCHPDLQVLWKLPSFDALEKNEASNILADEMAAGRVRIQKWLVAEPVAILDSGNVVCSVHHGGANTFYEAAWAGIPQVVLPQWLDTYDNAVRVEYLGIGVYGSRNVAPHVEAGEFARAVVAIVDGGEKCREVRERARALSEVCRRREGRKVAAEKIVELVGRE